MLEKILANPGGFVGGCLVWIPVAIWIYMAISWMLMGEAEIIPGVLCIMVAFSLGYFTSNPPTPMVGHILAATTALSLLAVPIVKHFTRTQMLQSIHGDQLQMYCDTLRQRPNPGTEFRIAQALWDQGDTKRSIAIAHRVIPNMPVGIFGTEHREFQSWLMRSRIDPNTLLQETQGCARCGRRCSISAVICPGCGNEVVLSAAKGTGAGLVRQILIGWSLVVGLVIAMPLIGVSLPAAISIPIIIAVLVGAGFVLVRLIGKEITI